MCNFTNTVHSATNPSHQNMQKSTALPAVEWFSPLKGAENVIIRVTSSFTGDTVKARNLERMISMKRIKLSQRQLPDYTRGEEIMNMVTHIVGGGVALAALFGGLLRSGGPWELAGSLIYSISMLCLYAMSSIYHGLLPSTGKKVLQILDHCTIYFLIAGTYTPIALCALRPTYPALGWGILAAQWGLTALAVTLTAIDLKKYNVFSMICYIGMGWMILPLMSQARQVLTDPGFSWLLAGGIAYTVGAILYGIGSKIRWFHSVFHIFVVLGSALQLVCIMIYVL